jgi:hypothetical protein
MSFATLVSRTRGQDSGQTTSHVIGNLASESYIAGDLLLVLVPMDGSSDLSLGSNSGGWSLNQGYEHSGGSFQYAVAAKFADDSVENLTLTSAVTETGTYELWIWRLNGGSTLNWGFQSTPVNAVGASTIVLPNFTPAGGVQDYSGIAFAATNSTLLYASASGDYAANFATQSAISTSGASLSSSYANHTGVSVVPGTTFTAGGSRDGLGTMLAVWQTGGGSTPPVIDSLVTAPTSASFTDLSFNTDQNNGNAYALVSSNATEDAADIIASGVEQAVVSSGAQSFTGLTWSSGQYVHILHVNAAAAESNVISALIVDGEAPVATGPLTLSNVTPTSYRVLGFEATDNLAVTGWRWRVAAGSWNTFNDTFFDVTGRTTDDVELVEVQARDAAGNWSNTLSKLVTVGLTTITITGLDFTYTSAGAGNNYSLKQALSVPRGHCTILWYEKRQTQTVYSGGVLFCNDSGLFDGGQDVAMFVTHGCPGTFASDGQRTSGDTSTMHHEIAGLSSAAFGAGNDYIASNSTLVQGAETQQSFDAVYDVWIPRVARITTDGTNVTHENYVDWNDKLKVIRQRILTSDIDDLAGERFWIGAPPWITNGSENFRARWFFLKQFSRPLSDAEIDTEFANFTDTPIAADCWFSNIFPVLSSGVLPDLKGFGTDHPMALYDGDTPAGFEEEFEVEPSVSSVVADYTSTYPILSAVTADLTASYALKNTVQQDFVNTYSILAYVQQDYVCTYGLLAYVVQDYVVTYGIAGTVLADYTANYQLQAPVQSDYTFSYNIKTQVQQDYGFDYILEAPVGVVSADYESTYQIHEVVASDFTQSYQMLETVIQDHSILYELKAYVTSDFALAYNIQSQVQSDYSFGYGLLNSVIQDFTCAYQIQQIVAQNYISTYSIDGVPGIVESEVTFDYALHSKIEADKDLTFQILNTISEDLVFAYALLVPVQADTVFAYSIGGKVEADLSISYNILNQVQQDLILAYALLASVSPELSIGYELHAYVQRDYISAYVIAGTPGTVATEYSFSYQMLNRCQQEVILDYLLTERVQADLIFSYLKLPPAGYLGVAFDVSSKPAENRLSEYKDES